MLMVTLLISRLAAPPPVLRPSGAAVQNQADKYPPPMLITICLLNLSWRAQNAWSRKTAARTEKQLPIVWVYDQSGQQYIRRAALPGRQRALRPASLQKRLAACRAPGFSQ